MAYGVKGLNSAHVELHYTLALSFMFCSTKWCANTNGASQEWPRGFLWSPKVKFFKQKMYCEEDNDGFLGWIQREGVWTLNKKETMKRLAIDQSTPIEQSHILKCMYGRRRSLTVIGITGYYKGVVTSHWYCYTDSSLCKIIFLPLIVLCCGISPTQPKI